MDTQSTMRMQPMTDVTISKLLTPEQVADVLGVAPHTLAVWRSEKRYDFPYMKCGRLVRYRAADVQAFVDRNLQATASC